MKQPVVAFCTTVKGRLQHLQKTLPENLDDNTYPWAKFIVLDYNSQDGLLEYLKANHSAAIERGQLVVYSNPIPKTFHMAHAKNMAHRCGMLEGADILVNVDADNFCGWGFAAYISGMFNLWPECFMWAKMVKDGEGRLPRGISGRIAVSRHAFLNAGGYDEQFDTHGPDDKDFNERLRRLGYVGVEIDPKYLRAVLHNDRMRFREYPHAANAGEDQFRVSHEKTVANLGVIGCGTVFRNFDFSHPIRLGPLPTRIFGIGMHKTATTSLHKALTILGFDSAHWKSAHWAKAIWKQMKEGGRSRTLEKHYALSDLPMPLIWRELDKAYPGSKFILTVRSKQNWIRSVRNHWNPEINPFRKGWNKDPFSHRAHKELYGQRGFDEKIFLARYIQHNREVMEHFAGRQNDLLVMNMEAADHGWLKLCAFLGQPVPENVLYPRMFATTYGVEKSGGSFETPAKIIEPSSDCKKTAAARGWSPEDIKIAEIDFLDPKPAEVPTPTPGTIKFWNWFKNWMGWAR